MQDFIRFIREANEPVILLHDDSDADALGAGYVLSRLTGGKIVVPKKVSEHGQELMDQIGFEVEFGPSDLREKPVIIADTADRQQLPEIQLGEFAVIDHHNNNKLLETAQAFFHEKVDSTCQLVFQVVKEMDFPVDREIALALSAGILGDTIYLEKASNETIVILGKILQAGEITFKDALEVLRISRKLSRETKLKAAIDAEIYWLEEELLVFTRTSPDYVYYVAMMLIELGADIALVLSQEGDDIIIRLVQSPNYQEKIDLLEIMKRGIGDSQVENLWGDENFVGFKGTGDDFRIIKDLLEQLCNRAGR